MYYHGARYRDAKTGVWLSVDPILEEYMPIAGYSDEARRQNRKLPGMGGVFNPVNLNGYQYAGNNPVVMTDPDGNHTCANPSNADKYVGNVIVFALNDDGTLTVVGEINLWGSLNNMNKQGTGFPAISPELKKAAEGRELFIMNYTTDENGNSGSYKAIAINGENPIRINEHDPDYRADNSAGRQLYGTAYNVDITNGKIILNKERKENVSEKYILREGDRPANSSVNIYNLVGDVKPNNTNAEKENDPMHDPVVQEVNDYKKRN